MKYFNWIAGLASLLGFILVIAGYFPEHELTRNYITVFCLGLFLGGLVGGIKHINISLPRKPVTLGILLFFLCSLVGLGILLIAGITTGEKEKRELFISMVQGGFFTLLGAGMVILLFGGLGGFFSRPD